MALLQNETWKNMFKKVWCMFWPKYSKLLAWTSFAEFQNGNMCSLALNFYVWSFSDFVFSTNFWLLVRVGGSMGGKLNDKLIMFYIIIFVLGRRWFLGVFSSDFFRFLRSVERELSVWGGQLNGMHWQPPPSRSSSKSAQFLLELGRNSEHFLHDLDFGRC